MQLSREELLHAYRTMRTIREFEERVKIEFEKGNIPGFVHLSSGEEASAVGVCMNLEEKDYIGSTHRGHGHCIAKGSNVDEMMLEIFAKEGGLCGGKGGSMHIADMDKGMLGANGIVGASSPLAIGAALTAKTLKTGQVAVGFLGDGASNQGLTFEAMNMAVVLNLPCVFLIENNGYGEFTGIDYHAGNKNLAARAEAMGMPATTVDGYDFFAVYDAAQDAIKHARDGKGPSTVVVECKRHHGHFLGDPQAYRSKEELEEVMAQDPLTRFRNRVTEAGLLEAAQLDAADAEAQAVIEKAVEVALNADFPKLEELHTDVYVAY